MSVVVNTVLHYGQNVAFSIDNVHHPYKSVGSAVPHCDCSCNVV